MFLVQFIPWYPLLIQPFRKGLCAVRESHLAKRPLQKFSKQKYLFLNVFFLLSFKKMFVSLPACCCWLFEYVMLNPICLPEQQQHGRKQSHPCQPSAVVDERQRCQSQTEAAEDLQLVHLPNTDFQWENWKAAGQDWNNLAVIDACSRWPYLTKLLYT